MPAVSIRKSAVMGLSGHGTEDAYPEQEYVCTKGHIMKEKMIAASGVLVFLILVSSILGGVEILTSIQSCLVVLGGTLVCGILSYPVQTFRDLKESLHKIWESNALDYAVLVQQIEGLARLRRVCGPRELNTAGDQADNVFLRKGIELIVDGYDRHEIHCIMEKEFEFYFAAKEAQINLLNTLAKFAPAFGFVGTIIGLIYILNHMSDPNQIGPGMAMALLTTLYGLLFANLCFLPLAKKLSEHVRHEALYLNMTLEGIIDICESKNPKSIAFRLQSYLSTHANETGVLARESMEDERSLGSAYF